MSDAPIHVVVAAFDTPDGASRMLTVLEDASTMGLETIEEAAVITRDARGKLQIAEPGDRGGGSGAVVGGVVGAALGLLAGPVGWAAGLGAVIGGLAAKLHDSGFPDTRLRALGESLAPGTSMLVVVVDPRWSSTLDQLLVEAGAATLTEEIGADIARQLGADRDASRSDRRQRKPSSRQPYF